MKRLLLVAVTGLLLAGCAQAPDVQLTRVRLGGLGLRGATLVAELRIENPNWFGIEADSIGFQLDAAQQTNANQWSNITRGMHAERYVLAKHSITTIKLPIEFPYRGLAAPLRSLLEQGTFNYRMNGAVYVRKPLHHTVPFSQQGNLSLSASQ